MLIIGSGAIATFLAYRLEALGCHLFVSESPRRRALEARFPGRVLVCPQQIVEQELWIVALKTWQNAEKRRLLERAPRPKAILVLQNGYRPEADWYGLADRVERGLTTYGVRLSAPGLVEGGLRGHLDLESGSLFARTLGEVGLEVREQANMERAIWQKLAVNASLNVVATLHDVPNGEVVLREPLRFLMNRAADEVRQVARACGVEWAGDQPGSLAERVALATKDNICSTLADQRAGRPTEYRSINGEILRLARDKEVAVPYLSALDREFRRRSAPGDRERAMPVFSARLPLLVSPPRATLESMG